MLFVISLAACGPQEGKNRWADAIAVAVSVLTELRDAGPLAFVPNTQAQSGQAQ